MLIALGLWACETKVDLNAPYERYTTVYGLVDLSADTQVVRINKAFLGEGNALDFAQVPDSSQYDPNDLEVTLEFANQTVELTPHIVPNRDPGAFFDQDVQVFITTENLKVNNQGNPINLNVNPNQLVNEYTLRIKVNGETIIGKTAPTFLRQISIAIPFLNNQGGSSFDNSENWMVSEGVFSQNKRMRMLSEPSAVRYEARIEFRYKEHYLDGTVKNRTYVWGLGSHEAPLGSTSAQFEKPYFPEDIFNGIANSIVCDPQIAFRSLDSCDFVMLAAGEDLARYMTINTPVTGIVTERPEFSNIEGDRALGLFSSRYKLVRRKLLSIATRQEFQINPVMQPFCFCNPAIPGSCPTGSCDCD